ncbi:hypothetical protein D3C84_856220 [compost metagenome]
MVLETSSKGKGTDSHFAAAYAVIHQFFVIFQPFLNNVLTGQQRLFIGLVNLPGLHLYIYRHFRQVPGLLLLQFQVLRLLLTLDQRQQGRAELHHAVHRILRKGKHEAEAIVRNLRAQQTVERRAGQALTHGGQQRPWVQRWRKQRQVQGIARYVKVVPQVVQSAFDPFPTLDQLGVERAAQIRIVDTGHRGIGCVRPQAQQWSSL